MTKLSSLILVFALICTAVFICGCTGGEKVSGVQEQPTAAAENTVLNVYHAGSLAAPMEEMEAAFETANPGVDVRLYSGGSTKLAKEIVELGKSADVYASADYSLIPNIMVPDFATWYATFAKNRMVLCYSDESKFADEVNADNWYDVLGREGVSWAFSDPNLDPCGYRSLMVIQLAESNYNNDQIFDNLVAKNSKITTTVEDGVTTIHATETEPVFPLSIDAKSVNLIAGLQAGNLDYAWEYRSVAEQNADSGIKYIEIPEAIDLSSIDFKDAYATVQVESSGGMKTGKPIVYGVTVLKAAAQPENGEKFVEMLVGQTGQDIMNKAGQPPIVPAVGFLDVPASLQGCLAVAN